MTRRLVLLLLASAPMMMRPSAQAQTLVAQPRYASVTLCEISFKKGSVNPKYVSIDAEFVDAIPHGLLLTDRRCVRNGLQIDFPDTGLDPSVAFIRKHIGELHRANGTFRGILKRDQATGRIYLWLQSVVNFQPTDPLEEPYKDEPIQLPEPPMPKLSTSP
jgi:hypothetical protein